MAKRVSAIDFKGGVGKTALAFNIAAGIVWEQGRSQTSGLPLSRE